MKKQLTSQLEKFERRWGKHAADKVAIFTAKERELVEQSMKSEEDKVKDIAEEKGIQKDEQWAVISRDFAQAYLDMMNASAERVSKRAAIEALKSEEGQAMVREAATQAFLSPEVQNAIRGMVRDTVMEMVGSLTQTMIQMAQPQTFVNPMNLVQFPGQPQSEPKIPEEVQAELKKELGIKSPFIEVPYKTYNKRLVIDWTAADEADIIMALLNEAEQKGIDIKVGNQLVKNGYASVYQRALKRFGGWLVALEAYQAYRNR